jgi:thiamine biosynthesis lipoprotein
MGTTYAIQLVIPQGQSERTSWHRAVEDELARCDRIFSTWRADSELSAVQRQIVSRRVPLSRDLAKLFVAARTLEQETLGYFDITAVQRVDGGFPRSNHAWHVAVDTDPPCLVVANEQLRFHVDGLAPGLVIDHLGTLLERRGVENYLIELGGELRARGHNERGQLWSVALAAPSDTTSPPPWRLALRNESLATSGDGYRGNESGGKEWSHIVDPVAGKRIALRGLSVAVLARDSAAADGWSTALYAMGIDRGLAWADERGVACCFLFPAERTATGHALGVRPSRAFQSRFKIGATGKLVSAADDQTVESRVWSGQKMSWLLAGLLLVGLFARRHFALRGTLGAIRSSQESLHP